MILKIWMKSLETQRKRLEPDNNTPCDPTIVYVLGEQPRMSNL